MWATVGTIMAGVGMLGGASSASIQGRASRKKAEEQTKQSKAEQEELNANSELARAIQKINNDRIMRAADKTYAAAATNLQRNRAARTTNAMLQQVAQAEAAGAYAASVASKGIGGSSADIIDNTIRLRDGLRNQLQKEADSQADYDAVQTLAGIIPAAWQQQDMTVLSGNQSAAAAVPTVQGGFNWASALGGSKELSNLAANLLSRGPTPNVQVNIPSGSLGSGTYGLNDFSTPTFFTSTSYL